MFKKLFICVMKIKYQGKKLNIYLPFNFKIIFVLYNKINKKFQRY
jgi:hypothetical protein